MFKSALVNLFCKTIPLPLNYIKCVLTLLFIAESEAVKK